MSFRVGSLVNSYGRNNRVIRPCLSNSLRSSQNPSDPVEPSSRYSKGELPEVIEEELQKLDGPIAAGPNREGSALWSEDRYHSYADDPSVLFLSVLS